MKEVNYCDLCSQGFYNPRYTIHCFNEFVFASLFLIRYIAWHSLKGFTLPKEKLLPCEICRHSARSHMLSPSEFDGTNFMGPTTAFNLFFHFKFILPQEIEFEQCLKCYGIGALKAIFRRKYKRSIIEHCYKRIGNLNYMLHLYEKGDKNASR